MKNEDQKPTIYIAKDVAFIASCLACNKKG
jgi:hypothetical protein